jgi:hypothetical protein
MPALAGVAVNVTLVPAQIAPGGSDKIFTMAGKLETTRTVYVAEAVQLKVSVPVTVYVVAAPGDTKTLLPVPRELLQL